MRFNRYYFFVIIFFLCSCSTTSQISYKGEGNNKIVLRNIGRKISVLKPDTFAKSNTVYVLKGDYSLDGGSAKVGANSTIIFEGGSLRDGVIIGDNTFIKVKKNQRLFRNISFEGTFLMPTIKSDYFIIDETTLKDMFDLSSDDIDNSIYINDDLTADIPSEWNGAVLVKSLSNIYINADVTLNTCSYKGGNIFYVRDCHDVRISGKGKIVGDLLTHHGDEGECIYGIFIRNAENIIIKGVTCEYFWGDGINIYPGQINELTRHLCKDIVIENVTCNSNRRQGISVIGGDNIIIRNSRFINTGIIRGTAPSSGIDIEPDDGVSVNNIVIEGCEFENNGIYASSPSDLSVVNNYGKVLVRRCRMNSFFYGHADNIEFENCEIKKDFYTSSSGIGKNVKIVNSKVNNINRNLIKNGNVYLFNSFIGE